MANDGTRERAERYAEEREQRRHPQARQAAETADVYGGKAPWLRWTSSAGWWGVADSLARSASL